MNDGHVRGQCATLASEEEAIQPEKKRRKLEQPQEEGGGAQAEGGAECSSSSSSSSNSNKSSKKKGNNSSTKQRKKSSCSICLKEGHNKTKCMYTNDPSVVPPVGPIRALSYPPHLSKPTKYVYLDFEWTTDADSEIIEVGSVPRIYCCREEAEEGGDPNGGRWESAGEAFSNLIRTRRPKNDKQLGTVVHQITGKKNEKGSNVFVASMHIISYQSFFCWFVNFSYYVWAAVN
jgi:hypothetical protein